MTQSSDKNNLEHWLDEANRYCPEHSIKILVGNKIDLIENINVRPINPIDRNTWKVIAAEKIGNY